MRDDPVARSNGKNRSTENLRRVTMSEGAAYQGPPASPWSRSRYRCTRGKPRIHGVTPSHAGRKAGSQGIALACSPLRRLRLVASGRLLCVQGWVRVNERSLPASGRLDDLGRDWPKSQRVPLVTYIRESDFLGDFEPIVQAMAETAIVLRRMEFASGHARYSQTHTGVVRAFPALLLGQNLGKIMVREARQA